MDRYLVLFIYLYLFYYKYKNDWLTNNKYNCNYQIIKINIVDISATNINITDMSKIGK